VRTYVLVMLVAAAVTYLATPVVRRLAVRSGAITAVRARDVHNVPTPRLGGLAMLAGLAVATAVASKMPFLAGVFSASPSRLGLPVPWAVLISAALVCLLGMADDVWDLDWMTKLVGQVLAAGFMAWNGVQLYSLPIGGITIASSRTWLFLTILLVVIAMNAVNFVDGLDGLAAGMIAIGGGAFFVYTYLLTLRASSDDYSNVASLVLVCLLGACLGFLPHNLHPARIFMGDSGSMVIGLVIAAAAIIVTGQINPAIVSQRQAIPAFLPIVLPFAVLLLPLLDMGLAVVRRLRQGKSPFHPDRLHLHHRMLQLGHSHRRAVFVLYLWTGLLAVPAALLAVWSLPAVLATFAVGAVAVLALTLGPLRGRTSSKERSA
jgi:UDP-N-acetylmuramyl pentapeptide phosphotransferase/UDP-N-acetylglucosamine-1-phosphate transferase